MRNSTPRLHSVQMKSGGAKMVVFRNRSADECLARFRDHCSSIVATRSDDMSGYAIVAWGYSGGISSAFKASGEGGVGTAMVPDFVRSALIDNIAGVP